MLCIIIKGRAGHCRKSGFASTSSLSQWVVCGLLCGLQLKGVRANSSAVVVSGMVAMREHEYGLGLFCWQSPKQLEEL